MSEKIPAKTDLRRKKRMKKRESTEFLTSRQVADALGLSPWTLYLWRKKHRGPQFVRLGPRMLRYPRRTLESWVASLPRI